MRGLFLTRSKLSHESIHQEMKIEQPKSRRWFGFNQKEGRFQQKKSVWPGMCHVQNFQTQMYTQYAPGNQRWGGNPWKSSILESVSMGKSLVDFFFGNDSQRLHPAGHSRQLGPGHGVSASCSTPNVPGEGHHGGGCNSLWIWFILNRWI